VILVHVCSFCGDELAKGSGSIYVKKDGTALFFCSSKCKRNQLNLKREGRRQMWTTASRQFKATSKTGKAPAKKKSKKKKKK